MAVCMMQALLKFSRLSLGPSTVICRGISTQTGPLAFRATAALGSEPMKKKKRVDASLIFQKEQKKKRRIEKAIRRLESKGRILKPIDEIEGNRNVLKTIEYRQRESTVLTFDESERRALIMKKWSNYRFNQHLTEMNNIQKMLRSQERALAELRQESEELYQAAIQVDTELLPLEMKGPVCTPPIDGYEAPDGEYVDTTKVFDK